MSRSSDGASRAGVLRRLAAAAGLEAIESQPRFGEPPPQAALFHLPAWSESGLDEARQLIRDLAPTRVIVLSEECHGGSCADLREVGAAACVALSEDEASSSQALASAFSNLRAGQGIRCPRCPLGVAGEEGPVCSSFVPDSLQRGWTGHDSHGALCFPFVAVSPAMRALEETARRVATSDATVLITGESGTGKEVLARYIHRCGGRAGAPFVKVNCAALPDHLLESELFGYEKGAFTGADTRKPGRFQIAEGGIVFLDEISEMSLSLQAKLLQVLEAKAFNRLGGVGEIKVDVQILAASNRDLKKEVSAGRFREDLYFRLKVIELDVPPLRERRGDIPRLVDYFLCRLSRQYSQPIPTLSPTVRDTLGSAPWDGNVRELENALRQLVILGDETPILQNLARPGGHRRRASDKAADAMPPKGIEGPPASLDLKTAARHAAREAERDAILTALNADPVEPDARRTPAGRQLQDPAHQDEGPPAPGSLIPHAPGGPSSHPELGRLERWVRLIA